MDAHNIGLLVIGAIIALFGWFGQRAVGGIDDKLKENREDNKAILAELKGKPGREEMGREIELGIFRHTDKWHSGSEPK